MCAVWYPWNISEKRNKKSEKKCDSKKKKDGVDQFELMLCFNDRKHHITLHSPSSLLSSTELAELAKQRCMNSVHFFYLKNNVKREAEVTVLPFEKCSLPYQTERGRPDQMLNNQAALLHKPAL